VLPDRFIDHDAPFKQYESIGLNASGIVATALAALGRPSASSSSAYA
jgi:1-deoxy-D-xylulose-5-phosphate synthase